MDECPVWVWVGRSRGLRLALGLGLVLDLLGLCSGGAGSNCGLGCHKVRTDVGLPVGLSVGLVAGVTAACASDQWEAASLFVSWAWFGGVPRNGPKVSPSVVIVHAATRLCRGRSRIASAWE